MNTTRFAVSVRRFLDYDPTKLCSTIEQWSAINSGQVRVTIQKTLQEDRAESQGVKELIFMDVEYDDYPTQGNRIIEIKQCIRTVTEHFDGIEFSGINIA